MATSWRTLFERRAPDPTGLPIGLRADGQPLTIPVGWHTLIGGLSGSGKSTTLRALLYSAAPIPDLAVVLVDVKRVESRPWRARASHIAVTQAEAIALLGQLLDDVARRYELLERLGRVEWTSDLGPRVLCVVDELAGIVATGTRADRLVVSLIRQLLERGRAAGVTLVLATQRPSADVIPTSIRDLCGLRIAHATADLVSTRMILAEAAELGPAHDLPIDDAHRGRCWAILDGTRVPVQARSYWVTVDEAHHHANRHAHHRVPWPPPTQFDTGPATTEPIAGAGVTASTIDPDRPARCPWPAPVPPSRAEPTPPTDEAQILNALAHGPLSAAALITATGLPEGRCRRARRTLAAAGHITETTAGWARTGEPS